jgi:hypothetical protein
MRDGAAQSREGREGRKPPGQARVEEEEEEEEEEKTAVKAAEVVAGATTAAGARIPLGARLAR